jgi:RNA polymerase-binding transcription factor DksA
MTSSGSDTLTITYVDRQDDVRVKPAFPGFDHRSPSDIPYIKPMGLRQEELQALLEDSYERQTEQLVHLTTGGGTDPGDPASRATRVAACRRSISAIAAALRDMADGSYGVCESCREPIAVERLRVRPEARSCVDCVVWPRR